MLMAVSLAPGAAAHVQSRPTDPPIVTAENKSWCRLRELLQVAGELYYPAGPAVFFDGNRMVRTGHCNGAPLYADTTLEPFSIVYVPIGRALMQPYERLRRGPLAGTAGSQTPALPAPITPDRSVLPMAPISPTAPSQPPGAISVFTPEPGAGTAGRALAQMATPQAAAPPADGSVGVVRLGRPESNDGIWISFTGRRWIARGPAVSLELSKYARIGECAGFPVYARREGEPDVIYVPSGTGLFTPYHLKGK